MAFSVIIPARYSSTRLPGKPLADIAGRPMIRHVWDRARESAAERVVVATDSGAVQAACGEFGAEAVLTDPDHASGTDRLEEVVRRLGMDEDAIVVNVQGDEPLIPPTLINQVAAALEQNQDAAIATLSERITSTADLFNPNVVKVVTDAAGRALYFSRAPIPWARGVFDDEGTRNTLPDTTDYYRHIGIYAYRVSLLSQFVQWPPAPLEQTESLEQLRALWHGARIQVAVAHETPPAGVDTPEDLERVRRAVAGQ